MINIQISFIIDNNSYYKKLGTYNNILEQVGALYSERASRSLPSAKDVPPEHVSVLTTDNTKIRIINDIHKYSPIYFIIIFIRGVLWYIMGVPTYYIPLPPTKTPPPYPRIPPLI